MEIFVKDFSEYPGLRHCSISDDSGEEFYHEILNYKFKECFERDETLIVNIDYTAGYAPSFLDEAFGNLVFDFSLLNIKKHLSIISNDEPDLKELIEKETFIQWEERRKENELPKITKKHKDWFRLVGDKIVKINSK